MLKICRKCFFNVTVSIQSYTISYVQICDISLWHTNAEEWNLRRVFMRKILKSLKHYQYYTDCIVFFMMQAWAHEVHSQDVDNCACDWLTYCFGGAIWLRSGRCCNNETETRALTFQISPEANPSGHGHLCPCRPREKQINRNSPLSKTHSAALYCGSTRLMKPSDQSLWITLTPPLQHTFP